MLEALRATIGTRRIARPVKGLREGLGYYIAGGRVWLHDPTALAADLRSTLRQKADWPLWEIVDSEWTVEER